MDRMTIEISAQEFGARAYIRTRFRYSTNGIFWAGFTYDAYCEAADSASDITCCVAGQIEQSAGGPSGRQERGRLLPTSIQLVLSKIEAAMCLGNFLASDRACT
jgi:hypothetical protein